MAIARFCGVAVEIAMYDCVVFRGSSPGPLYRRPGLKDYMNLTITRSLLSFMVEALPHTPWSLRVWVGAEEFGTLASGPSG